MCKKDNFEQLNTKRELSIRGRCRGNETRRSRDSGTITAKNRGRGWRREWRKGKVQRSRRRDDVGSNECT